MNPAAALSQIRPQPRRYSLLEALIERPRSREDLQTLLGYAPDAGPGRIRVCQLLAELRDRDGILVYNFNCPGSHRGGYYMAVAPKGWGAPERYCTWRRSDGSICETILNHKNPGPLCLVHDAMAHDREIAALHDPPQLELVGVGA